MKSPYKYVIDFDIWIKRKLKWNKENILQDCLNACRSEEARKYVEQKFKEVQK